MPSIEDWSDDESITDAASQDMPPPPTSTGHIVLNIDGDEKETRRPKFMAKQRKSRHVSKRQGYSYKKTRFEAADPMVEEDEAYSQYAGIRPMKENTIWDLYNNEARMVDRELVKDWSSSLNSLLLFAAIFAAVLTAFIVESKQLLEQDPLAVMTSTMLFYTNNLASGTHSPFTQTPFRPPSWAVSVNCLFFTSLSGSIVAALASVVALQWVAEYDAATTRAGFSPEERVKRRQLRFGGAQGWKIGEIIAILPLLLYFSVLLFFIGLTQWMWYIHRSVAYIILSLGMAAFVIYFASTLIAVIDPSAPFRTPLSKSIYSLGHIPFSLLYYLSQRFDLHKRFPSQYFDINSLALRRFSKASAQNRDSKSIRSDPGIVRDGLIWLSTHLSLSSDSDSVRRLLLLLKEVTYIKPDPRCVEEFREAPFGDIFEALGSHYLQRAYNYQVTDHDLDGLKILYDCFRVNRFVLHITGEEPASSDRGKGLTRFEPTSLKDPINAACLLFCKTPDLGDRSIKMVFRYRLAQWYLMRKYPSQETWKEQWTAIVRAPGDAQEVHRGIVYEALIDFDRAPDYATNYQKYIDSLTGLISITWQGFGKASRLSSTLCHPLFYKIHSKSWINWECLEHMWNYYTSQDKITYTMHDIYDRLHRARKQHPDMGSPWRYSPQAGEIEEALSSIHPLQRSDVLSLINEELEDLHLLEAILSFDKTLKRHGNPDERATILDLICTDLEEDLPNGCGLYWTEERKSKLGWIHSSPLQLVACACSGVEWPAVKSYWLNSQAPFSWDPWARASWYCCGSYPSHNPESIGKLRTQLWNLLSLPARKDLLSKVLVDVEKLVLLESQFLQPDLGVEHGGDFLLLQLSKIESSWGDGDVLKVDKEIDNQVLCIKLIPALLLNKQGERLPPLTSNSIPVARQCIDHLVKLCDDVKASQTRLAELLCKIYSCDITDSSEFAAMVLIMERHVDTAGTSVPSAFRRALAERLCEKIEAGSSKLSWWDPDEGADCMWRCSELIRELRTPRPEKMGLTSRRLLSCPRGAPERHPRVGTVRRLDSQGNIRTEVGLGCSFALYV